MVRLMLEGRLLRDMGLVVFIGDFSLLGEERLLAKLLILSLMSLLLGSLLGVIKRLLRLLYGHLYSEVLNSNNLGACAGISFFLGGYPFDYMKTLMQTDDLEKKKYKNLRDVFFQRLKEGGAKTFYKGLGVTLIRAIFVNAGAFFSFEASMRALGRSEHSE